MEIDVQKSDERTLVTLSGDLDASTASLLYDQLSDLEVEDVRHVVLDLAQVTFMDSTGITALVGARNRIMDDGPGQLVLSRPVCAVRRFRKLPDCLNEF